LVSAIIFDTGVLPESKAQSMIDHYSEYTEWLQTA
jgi:hypothetical protein